MITKGWMLLVGQVTIFNFVTGVNPKNRLYTVLPISIVSLGNAIVATSRRHRNGYQVIRSTKAAKLKGIPKISSRQ